MRKTRPYGAEPRPRRRQRRVSSQSLTAHATARAGDRGRPTASRRSADRQARSVPMRPLSVRRSSSISTQPASPADSVRPAAPQLRVDPEPARQRDREHVSEHRGQRDADDGVTERRPRVAQRVVGGRIQPAERRREQPDRRAGENAPHVHRVLVAEPSGLKSAAAMTSPNARNATADGTTKNAI